MAPARFWSFVYTCYRLKHVYVNNVLTSTYQVTLTPWKQRAIDDIGPCMVGSKVESEAAGVPRCKGSPLATPGSACS